jgi:hypothetical protein
MMVSRILERAGEEVTEELLDGRAAGRRRGDEGLLPMSRGQEKR